MSIKIKTADGWRDVVDTRTTPMLSSVRTYNEAFSASNEKFVADMHNSRERFRDVMRESFACERARFGADPSVVGFRC